MTQGRSTNLDNAQQRVIRAAREFLECGGTVEDGLDYRRSR
jgi:hypothetical protein